ncbi:MAG: hypothetical protein CMC70_03300 [Flavobacteriaceae bacterium]|mgnify:CR=1 FL=1|nr:hypothetical protein [Flavobacteriaceae bacterium]
MKILKLTPFLLLFAVFASCTSVRVATDYDRKANFSNYTSFAFYKPGVDEAKISDLDKKRILRAIEANLQAKGMTKSEAPTLLVSIFTKERERVDVYNNNFGYGWGWNPWYYGGGFGNTVSRSTEGSLYIDLIDARTNELVWQGVGSSQLYTGSDIDRREEKIREIVSEILAEYPPGTMAKN